MTAYPPQTARLVTPRKWALLGTVAAGSLALAQAPLHANVFATPAQAQTSNTTANTSAEAGEAGEGGTAVIDGPTTYLTALGELEATYRVVSTLYSTGEPKLAQAHLAASTHGDYDQVESAVEEHGASDFEGLVENFADAVAGGAAPETVAAAADAVLAAIDAARNVEAATPREVVMALKALMASAANDYADSIDAGQIVDPQEYRDAWGLVETVRVRATELAQADDVEAAKAGADVLNLLTELGPLFPGPDATEAGGDPTLLPATAAWIEIIALRLG